MCSIYYLAYWNKQRIPIENDVFKKDKTKHDILLQKKKKS